MITRREKLQGIWGGRRTGGLRRFNQTERALVILVVLQRAGEDARRGRFGMERRSTGPK